ncbi:DUF1648 domain-containing protein [Streptomyces sp. NPDC090442]|uniref:DUF1648 domain-containing protein n=1 Tax=Streptomyces sp. NPDC090442 TaxID=3365962 RepID=UPI00381FCE8D
MVFSPPVRLWLLPSAALLAVLALWGVLRYPHLPNRIPRHIGVNGVDAWTERSIGSAFVLVFVYVGVTVLLTACAELTLRVTPQDELPKDTASFGNGLTGTSLNRPRTRASAIRAARALLVLNASVGISLLVGCGVLWRSTANQEVPNWLFAAMLLPLLAGTGVTVAAGLKDRRTPAS